MVVWLCGDVLSPLK